MLLFVVLRLHTRRHEQTEFWQGHHRLSHLIFSMITWKDQMYDM